MQPIFYFPIVHKACDTCKSRFECLTTWRVRYEMPSFRSIGGHIFSIYLNTRISLDCIRVEPYWRILEVIAKRDGVGTKITIKWE